MKLLRWIVGLLIEIGWALDWVYLPERDAVPYIYRSPDRIEEDLPDPEPVQADPGTFDSIKRFDGVNGSPDYSDWSWRYDGAAWIKLGWSDRSGAMLTFDAEGKPVPPVGTSKRRRNYMKVRPLVIQGESASAVAAYFEQSQKWAEEYVTAVRMSLRYRWEDEQDAPPLSEGEGAKTPVILEF